MAWFKDKLDDRNKALIGDVVAAYAERCQLSSELFSIRPPVTDIEMAVLWAYGYIVMENSDKENPDSELLSTARTFFDSFCQSYIGNICGSKLKLDPESAIIRDNMTQTLEEMSPDRLASTGQLSATLMSNATKLAGATLAMLNAGLTEQQGRAAAKHADSLVASEPTLSPLQRQLVRSWLTNFSWQAGSLT
jgi:hypothetical protein